MVRKAFTLLEMIVVMTMFFILLSLIIVMYNRMLRVKYNVEARQTLLQDSYYIMEKVNILIKDYTIDYEEYYNR